MFTLVMMIVAAGAGAWAALMLDAYTLDYVWSDVESFWYYLAEPLRTLARIWEWIQDGEK